MTGLKMVTKDIAQRLYHKFPWVVPSIIKNLYFKKKYIDPYKNRRLPTIWLETTSACNLNCVMCPAQRKDAKRIKPDGFMKPELFRRLVDEIAAEDPDINLRLHKDGEPLLHPDIVEFIRYSSAKINRVSLVTNATLLTNEMTDAILGTRLQDIRFSIDGTKETFNKIRVQSKDNPYASQDVPVDHDNVVAKVLHFCRRRKELNNTTIRIGVRMTDFKPTEKERETYKAFWEQHVDYVEIARYISWSGKIYKSKNENSTYPCLNLWSTLTVTYDGKMVPCCTYMDTKGNGKGKIADLNDPNVRLKEAFYDSQELNEVRRAHLDGDDLEEIAPYCVKCDDWNIPEIDKIWTKKMRREMRPQLPT